MKPKTIRDLLKDYGICKCGTPTDSPNFAYHICIEQGLLFQIQQLLEECAPEEIEEGDGWAIHFSQSDTLGMGGKVIKKGKARSCCPGDDIAYAHNQAIDQYKSNIRMRLK